MISPRLSVLVLALSLPLAGSAGNAPTREDVEKTAAAVELEVAGAVPYGVFDVRVDGRNVIIEGEVLLESELEKIKAIASRRSNVVSRVTLSPLAIKALARTIEQNIRRPGVKVLTMKATIVLEGSVRSDSEKARAEAIAKKFYPDIMNLLEVRER
jgi:osmotically-inducible protein OsmY